jgi:hypothetical protein
MLGNPLYSYHNLKLAKMLCLPYYLLCILFKKLENNLVHHMREWHPSVHKVLNYLTYTFKENARWCMEADCLHSVTPKPPWDVEPHLAEIKQQPKSKLWHHEPLACGKLLHISYTEKTYGLPLLPQLLLLAPNLHLRHSADQTGECYVSLRIHPWDKPAQPLGSPMHP